MDTPEPREAHGSSRNPAEAKNGLSAPRIRIFPGNTALALWVAVPDPHTWTRRAPAEAHGSPTMLKMAESPIDSEYFREIQRPHFGFPRPTPLHGHAGSPPKLTEAHGI